MQSVIILVLHGAVRRKTETISLLNSEYSTDIQSKVLKGKLEIARLLAEVIAISPPLSPSLATSFNSPSIVIFSSMAAITEEDSDILLNQLEKLKAARAAQYSLRCTIFRLTG